MIKNITIYTCLTALLALIPFNTAFSRPGLSPNTKLLLREYGKNPKPDKILDDGSILKNRLIIGTINGIHSTGALIKVSNTFVDLELKKLGVSIGTKAGSIWTIQAPLESLGELAALDGIDYLQIDEPIGPSLDSARRQTGIDLVQQGFELPKAYTGKGVVVGIIDNGFDLTHPAFFDTSGQELRIKKIWDQNKNGNPPTGFNYGTEFIGKNNQVSLDFDLSNDTHGTHVAAIATGSGFGTDGKYRGMAPESEIVLVSYFTITLESLRTGQSKIIDAINYIFNYAASQGKPAVVNMSFGYQVGPHDGTSLFDQALDELVGPGRIVIGAVGNSGGSNMHIGHNFSKQGKEFSTVVVPGLFSMGQGEVDIWGNRGNIFCSSISLYNYRGFSYEDSTITICCDRDTVYTDTLISSNIKICPVIITTIKSDFNGKPRINIKFANKTSDFALLTCRGDTGMVHLWNISTIQGSEFFTNDYTWLVPGDSYYTPSEISGTAKRIISVGAVSSRRRFVNIDGQWKDINLGNYVGDLAPFSSWGPTADGRVKPEITAPGHAITSAINSFYYLLNPTGSRRADLAYCHDFKGKAYCYAPFSGTSMAAPVVTGTVALLLQINPRLTPEEIREILKRTAIQDEATGPITEAGSPQWGWGKLNAYEAVKYEYLASVPGDFLSGSNLRVFPNPSSGEFTIAAGDGFAGEASLLVCDLTGREVFRRSIYMGMEGISEQVTLPNIGTGVYMLKLRCGRNLISAMLVIADR